MRELTTEQVWRLAGDRGYLASHLQLGLDDISAPPVFILSSALSALAAAANEGPMYSKYLSAIHPLYSHHYRINIGTTGSGKTMAERPTQRVLGDAIPDAIHPTAFTWEALMDRLRQKPGGYLFGEEWKGFQARLNRDYNSGAEAFMIEAFDSPPQIRRLTKGGGLVEVKRPRLTLAAGSTKEYFSQAIKEGDFEGGWLARFIFVQSNTVPPLRRPSVKNVQPILDSLVEHLKKVAKLKGDADFRAVDSEAWPYLELAQKQVSQVDSKIRGFWTRIGINTVKLSMLFHVSDCPDDLIIRQQDWTRAVLFMDHVKEVMMALADGVATSFDGKNLNRMRSMVPNDGLGLDRRTMLQKANMTARDFNGYITTLQQTGEIHIHEQKNRRGPATQFIINAERCSKCQSNGHDKEADIGETMEVGA